MENKELKEQVKLAFEYIDKLYLEISFLIKELEGILSNEDEEFVIVKPSGYKITTKGSTGLESNNVSMWLIKKIAVAFVSKVDTKINKGTTVTDFTKNLKVVYVRFVLDDKDINEPTVYFGILHSIVLKQKDKWIKKFENLISHIEYAGDKFFGDNKNINYSDNIITVKGDMSKCHLLDLNDNNKINKEIIQPLLKMYREHKS